MNIRNTRIINFATAAMFAFTAMASAQAPATGSPSRPDAPPASAAQQDNPQARNQPRMQVTPIEGVLMDVDTEKKTFVVMTDTATGATPGVSTGPESRVEFAYTDATQVEGVEKGVQGLADRRSTRMTVHFLEQDGKKVATRIEMTPGSGPDSAPGAAQPR